MSIDYDYRVQVQAWYLNPIVALNSILMWSKLLYFALAFERTSALVRMVLEVCAPPLPPF